MKKNHTSCKACKTERSSARRTWPNGLETVRRPRRKSKNYLPKSVSVIKISRIHMEAEAELDEEIRILQPGDERRNSCASKSNGCFDPAEVEQFITMGETQAWQQPAFIQGELSRVFGVQLQPAPATPVHVPEEGEGGDENEEEQRKRPARSQMGQPAPGGRS